MRHIRHEGDILYMDESCHTCMSHVTYAKVVSHMSVTAKDAVCCGVLRRVAVCCSVLRCVAVCCGVLQCTLVSELCTFSCECRRVTHGYMWMSHVTSLQKAEGYLCVTSHVDASCDI